MLLTITIMSITMLDGEASKVKVIQDAITAEYSQIAANEKFLDEAGRGAHGYYGVYFGTK